MERQASQKVYFFKEVTTVGLEIKPSGSKCRHLLSYCLCRVMDLGYLSASSRQL